jgi:hypothetical protein
MSVKEEIIQQLRIKGTFLISWNLKNIVPSVINILFIGR